MPAVTVTGLGSGIQSDEIIQKLKEVERQPIVELEKERTKLDYEVQALEQLRNKTERLQQTLKALYGFDSALSKNKLVSVPQGFVDGLITGAAKEGKHNILMDHLAQNLSITSRNIKTDEILPPATIGLGQSDSQKSASFAGGSAIDFVNFLNENFGDDLRSRLVQINKNFIVIAIDGKSEGKKGILYFADPDALLANLELVNTVMTTELAEPSEAKEEQTDANKEIKKMNEVDFPLLFTGDKLWTVQEGPISIQEQNTVLQLGEHAARRMEIQKPQGQDNLILSGLAVRAYLQEEAPAPQDDAPYALKDGPSEKINIDGVELKTYNITRTRPMELKKEETFDYGIVLHYKKPKFPGEEEISGGGKTNSENNTTVTNATDSDKKQKTNIEKVSLKGKQLERIDVTPGLVAIDFYTENAKVQFSNVRTIYQVGAISAPSAATKTDNSNNSEKTADTNVAMQKSMYPHLLKPARNAVFDFDGVRVERDKNTDIMDLISGATVHLLSYTNQKVDFEIKHDVDNAVQKIQDFVDAYNDLLDFTQKVSQSAQDINMPNKYKNLRERSGILLANTTVRNLMDGLHQKIFSLYYTLDNQNVRIISAIGINGGEDRQEWKNLQGKLKLNSDALYNALVSYPQEVENFLAYDRNGDFRFDDGMAYSTYTFLEPYTRETGGLITAQIKSKNERMTSVRREIARVEEHADKYEENLRKKFGYMDSVVRQQKSTSEYLKNKFKND